MHSSAIAPECAHSHASSREQGKEHIASDCWFSELEYVQNGRTQLALDKAPTPPRLVATCPAYRAKAREAAHAQRIRAFMDTRSTIPWREVLGYDLEPPPPAEHSDSDSDVPHTGPTSQSPRTPGGYMRRRWGVVGAESQQTAVGAIASTECNRGECGCPLLFRGAGHPRETEVLTRRGGDDFPPSLRADSSWGHLHTLAVCWAPVEYVAEGGAAAWQGADGHAPLTWAPAPRPGWEIVDSARPPRASAGRGEFCATLERLETFCLSYAAVAPLHEPRDEWPRRRPRARRRKWSPAGRAAVQQSHLR